MSKALTNTIAATNNTKLTTENTQMTQVNSTVTPMNTDTTQEQSASANEVLGQPFSANNLAEKQAQEDIRIAQNKEHQAQEKLRVAKERENQAVLANLLGFEGVTNKKLSLELCTVEQLRERISVSFTKRIDGDTTVHVSLGGKVPLFAKGMNFIRQSPNKAEAEEKAKVQALPAEQLNALLLAAQEAYKKQLAMHDTKEWKDKKAAKQKEKSKIYNAKLSHIRSKTVLLQVEAAELAARASLNEYAGDTNGNR